MEPARGTEPRHHGLLDPVIPTSVTLPACHWSLSWSLYSWELKAGVAGGEPWILILTLTHS